MDQSIDQIKSINHHFRHAIEQVGEGILIIEATSRHPLGPRIVFANPAVSRLSGHTSGALADQPIGLIYEPECVNDLILRLPRVAGSEQVFEMEKEMVSRDGDRIPCRWSISSICDSRGAAVNFVLCVSLLSGQRAPLSESAADAPQRERGPGVDRNIEESLEQCRVESLALLAGGIAHDFNNVLQIIVTNLSLAKLETSVHAPEREHVEAAIEATEIAESLAQQILDFTRGREPMVQVVNLGDVLRKVAQLSTMGSRVRCDIVTPEGLWGVEADLRQIRQVIHNLMVNACQSMPSGGVVQAFAENFMVKEGSLPGLAPGPHVVVRVRDRGCGIPREKLAEIFEPYYTTKENGTGIGLATCRAIVKRHRGTIKVGSKINVGTEFRVFLPACRIFEEAPAGPGGAGAGDTAPGKNGGGKGGSRGVPLSRENSLSSPAGGEECILVVDDHDSVRDAAERLLTRLGYRTIPAATGQDAVSLFRQHARSGDPINAVLLDMTLPGGLSGEEVMRELRKVDGNACVIATSGYFGDDAEAIYRRDGYAGILPKPYGVERLSQTVAEALEK